MTVESHREQVAMLHLQTRAWNTDKRHRLLDIRRDVELEEGENVVELTLEMGDGMLTWSEFHPAL